MAKYLLFSGGAYEAAGGMDDFVKGFDNIDETMKFLKENPKEYFCDWWHVADVETCKIIILESVFLEDYRPFRCGYCGEILKFVCKSEEPDPDEDSYQCDDCKRIIASDAALLARNSEGVE